MYELKDIKVTLLNPDEVSHFIRNHGYIACICYDTMTLLKERRLLIFQSTLFKEKCVGILRKQVRFI